MKRVPDSETRYDPDDGLYYLGDELFTGVCFTLHPDGALASECELRDGVEWGTARRWSRGGTLVLDRQIEAGVCHGRSREWHPNGALATDEEWELGVCVSRRRWGPGGELLEEWGMKPTDPAYRTLQSYRRLNQARRVRLRGGPAEPSAAADPVRDGGSGSS